MSSAYLWGRMDRRKGKSIDDNPCNDRRPGDGLQWRRGWQDQDQEYQFKPEATWKSDPQVEAARKVLGWVDFHKTCAKSLLFFDHIEKSGRNYLCVAIIGSGAAHKAGEGREATPILALNAAYRACGLRVPEAEPFLDKMLNPDTFDIEDVLG